MGGPRNKSQAGCECEGCDRPLYSRGLCSSHYQRWNRAGDGFDRSPIGKRMALARTIDGVSPDAASEDQVRCKFGRILQRLEEENPLGRQLVIEMLTSQGDDRKGTEFVAAALSKTVGHISGPTIQRHLKGGCPCPPGCDPLWDFGLPDRSGKF